MDEVGSLRWTTNDHGLLTEPRVRDALLSEISSRPTTLAICIDDGGYLMFWLQGVKEANFSIGSGSTISEIHIWRAGDLEGTESETFEAAWKPLFERRLHDRDIEGAAREIMEWHPDSFLLVLACSNGGTIACVADAFSCFRAPGDRQPQRPFRL